MTFIVEIVGIGCYGGSTARFDFQSGVTLLHGKSGVTLLHGKSGVTLLHGKSGCGKSSIFAAISWYCMIISQSLNFLGGGYGALGHIVIVFTCPSWDKLDNLLLPLL